MRLGRMRELLEISVPVLAKKTAIHEAANIGGNAAHKLAGIGGAELRRALNHIAQVPGLNAQAREILSRPIVRNAPDLGEPTATVGSGDTQTLKTDLGVLRDLAEALRETLEAIAPPADEHLLFVRAPDDVNDLAGLEQFVDDLKEGLEMPVRLLTGQHLVFRGVERGSTWLVIGLLTIGVFQATRALIGVCEKYCRRQNEREEAEKTMRELGAFTDAMGNAAKDGVRMYGLTIAKELDEAFSAVHPPDHEKDVPQKLLHSVEILAGLYYRGVQLQLSSGKKPADAEAEGSDEMRQLTEAVVKLLGDGKGST